MSGKSEVGKGENERGKGGAKRNEKAICDPQPELKTNGMERRVKTTRSRARIVAAGPRNRRWMRRARARASAAFAEVYDAVKRQGRESEMDGVRDPFLGNEKKKQCEGFCRCSAGGCDEGGKGRHPILPPSLPVARDCGTIFSYIDQN